MVIYKKSFSGNIDAAIERAADRICRNTEIEYSSEMMLANVEMIKALTQLIEASYPIVNGPLVIKERE